MVSATTFRDQVREKMREIRATVSGLSDQQAATRPSRDEWCVKEVLSHLLSDNDASLLDGFRQFVKEDTPEFEVTPGLAYYKGRESKSIDDLLGAVERRLNDAVSFLDGLNDEQLSRKAHVSLLKETPLGEYPTLVQWAGVVINYHLTEHINQLRKLCDGRE